MGTLISVISRYSCSYRSYNTEFPRPQSLNPWGSGVWASEGLTKVYPADPLIKEHGLDPEADPPIQSGISLK